jgi:calcineurin-like phosphoesterase family protein
MDLKNYKRAWMITDTHLGVRNSSVEWLDIMKEYFRDFFIPLLKKEKKEGDFLVHLGDVFDSRHSLNLLVMNEGISIFEEISKIMPVVIILGNHDIYKKNSNDVNSVKVLKWIPNIAVLEEPKVLNVSGKRLLMMPWRAGHQEELECIQKNPADFMFCHTEMQGLRFNRNTTIETGLDFKEILNFRKVFAGHIHYAQQKGNFRMLGCPYPMTRSDINNEKGIWCFDVEKEEEIYYPNTVSPKFVRMTFERVLEMEEDEARELFKNNFVDILVDPKWSLNFPFSVFSEDMKGYRRLDFVARITNLEDEDGLLIESEETEMERIDILELSKKIIYNTQHSDSIKEKLLSTVKNLYDRVQKSQEEEKDNE